MQQPMKTTLHHPSLNNLFYIQSKQSRMAARPSVHCCLRPLQDRTLPKLCHMFRVSEALSNVKRFKLETIYCTGLAGVCF